MKTTYKIFLVILTVACVTATSLTGYIKHSAAKPERAQESTASATDSIRKVKTKDEKKEKPESSVTGVKKTEEREDQEKREVKKDTAKKATPAYPDKQVSTATKVSASANAAKQVKESHIHTWATRHVVTQAAQPAQYRTDPVYETQEIFEEQPVYQWASVFWCGVVSPSRDHIKAHAFAGEPTNTSTKDVRVGTKQVLVKAAVPEKGYDQTYCTSCGAIK